MNKWWTAMCCMVIRKVFAKPNFELWSNKKTSKRLFISILSSLVFNFQQLLLIKNQEIGEKSFACWQERKESCQKENLRHIHQSYNVKVFDPSHYRKST